MKNKNNTVAGAPIVALEPETLNTIEAQITRYNSLSPIERMNLANEILSASRSALTVQLSKLKGESQAIEKLLGMGTVLPVVPSVKAPMVPQVAGGIRISGKKLATLTALKALGKPSTIGEIEAASGLAQLNYILNKQLLPAGFVSKTGEGSGATFSYVKGV